MACFLARRIKGIISHKYRVPERLRKGNLVEVTIPSVAKDRAQFNRRKTAADTKHRLPILAEGIVVRRMKFLGAKLVTGRR
jgi:hypothetical protein